MISLQDVRKAGNRVVSPHEMVRYRRLPPSLGPHHIVTGTGEMDVDREGEVLLQDNIDVVDIRGDAANHPPIKLP